MAEPSRRLRIAVVAWELGHNAVIRPYYLADMLSREHDVELVGMHFPPHGTELWEPIRATGLRVRSMQGCGLPELIGRAESFTRDLQADLVCVCTARFPSLLLGMLIKHRRGAPVVVDIDEVQLNFTAGDRRLTLDQLARQREDPDFRHPEGSLWTAAADTLAGDADAIIVASEALVPIYGGTVMPQVRDERVFVPARFDRVELRRQLGFDPDDRVVMFAGTARQHKGVLEISRALAELGDERYRLCVVGPIGDAELRSELAAAGNVALLGARPVSEIPALLAVGDLCCLPQDPMSAIAVSQIPGKLTEALAMEVPVLATRTPTLAPFADRGLIQTIGDEPLSARIAALFAEPEAMAHGARLGRRYFLDKMSYAAGLRIFNRVAAELRGGRTELPKRWRRARQLASMPAAKPAAQRAVTPSNPNTARARRSCDIVCFWRLNDSGLYGRRPDMLMKYLARADWTHRLIHFDNPVDWDWLQDRRSRTGQSDGINHWDQIARRGRRRAVMAQRHDRLRSYTFVARSAQDPALWQRLLLPSYDEYLGYVSHVLKRNGVGRRRVLMWLWPPIYDFAALRQTISPDLIVADVIDDARSWLPVGSNDYGRISRNYDAVLGASDLVLAHSEGLAERLRWFGVEPEVVPNALELLRAPRRPHARPRELRDLKGPLIGYVGGLGFRLDIPLLHRLASENPDCEVVMIGSADGSDDALALREHANVHLLGVRRYPDAMRYIRCFDVAIIPHLDNEMSRGMSPLKAYVYAACEVPIVSTDVANLVDLGSAITVAHSHDEFLAMVREQLERRRRGQFSSPARSALEPHTWPERIRQIEGLIDRTCSSSSG